MTPFSVAFRSRRGVAVDLVAVVLVLQAFRPLAAGRPTAVWDLFVWKDSPLADVC